MNILKKLQLFSIHGIVVDLVKESIQIFMFINNTKYSMKLRRIQPLEEHLLNLNN